MAELTLADLVRNGTMDEHVAATLWTIAEERRSFLVAAVPRFAGKSTVSRAMLDYVPDGTAVHMLSGGEAEMRELAANPDGGYLVVGELSRAPVSHYIWGRPVRTYFETVRTGFSLATAMHAPTPEDAFALIGEDNGVPEGDASLIDFFVYIERMGNDRDDFWRRVAAVYEIGEVSRGVPETRLLHRWEAEGDRFERVESPGKLSLDAAGLDRRAGEIRAAADAVPG